MTGSFEELKTTAPEQQSALANIEEILIESDTLDSDERERLRDVRRRIRYVLGRLQTYINYEEARRRHPEEQGCK